MPAEISLKYLICQKSPNHCQWHRDPAMGGTSGNKNDRFVITPKINRLTVSLWFEDCCDSKQIWLSCTAIHQFGSFSTFCRLTRSKVSHHGKYCFWHTFSRTSDHYQLNADASFLPFHFIIIGLQLSVSHVLHYLVWTCDDCFLWWDMTKCSC